MSHISHTYILLHLLSDPNQYDFDNTLELEIRSSIEDQAVLYTCDNFSDSVTLSYVSDLLKAEKVTIICDLSEGITTAGKLASIFNQLIRHPNVRLFVNREALFLKPYMIRLKGIVYTEVREVLDNSQ
ncbi:MAG: hypothetical protein RIC35_10255 [Marinoscillum sp.]